MVRIQAGGQVKKLRIDKKKLRKLSKTKNPFVSLVRSIIFQQLATGAATTIYNRFVELFENNKPTPEQILKLTASKFKKAGISGRKMAYLQDLSRKFLDGTINPKNFHRMEDVEISKHLILVKGIGQWTADMFLIFALNRPNVLPVGDLGVKLGFQKAFSLKSIPSERTMRRLAKPHEGEYTNLALYLWFVKDSRSK